MEDHPRLTDHPTNQDELQKISQALRTNMLLLWSRLDVLQASEDYFLVDEDTRKTFRQFKAALEHLKNILPVGYPLGEVIAFIQHVNFFIQDEFLPPPKPCPLPKKKHAPWAMIRPWMVWHYDKRSPGQGWQDRQLALAMGRSLRSVKGYKEKYRQELEDLKDERQKMLNKLG